MSEKINNHSMLKLKIELDKETKREFEKIIEQENSNLIVKIETNKNIENEIFNGIIDYFEILYYVLIHIAKVYIKYGFYVIL